MYVEEIITKRNGKEYKTILVRESYRVGSTVSHRTIANISHLPRGCVEEIKRYLKGVSRDLDFSQVRILDSKEYGASQAVLTKARKLGLDKIIFPRKVQWREDLLALTVARLLYHGNEASLVGLFKYSILWESCGHLANVQPNLRKNCYEPLKQLYLKRKAVQKNLRDKHLDKESAAFIFFISTHIEEECGQTNVTYHHEPKQRYREINTILLTNDEGCPLAIESFCDTNEMQKKLKIFENLDFPCLVKIGDQKRISQVGDKELPYIAALTSAQINDLVKRDVISSHHFSTDQFEEIEDSADPFLRYILCRNIALKKDQKHIRDELIKKSEEQLRRVQKKSQNLTLELGKIWTTYRTEKFFNWQIVEGQLHYSINNNEIHKQQQLDGCYVIRTNIKKEILTTGRIINAYNKLGEIQLYFRDIKILSPEIFHQPLEDCIHSHLLLSMLSYYLYWNMTKRLEGPFKVTKDIKSGRCRFNEAIDKLKAIRSQTLQIGCVTLDNVITTLDLSQRDIIAALGVAQQFPVEKNIPTSNFLIKNEKSDSYSEKNEKLD